MDEPPVSPEWAETIRAEHKRLLADEEHLHNNLMHEHILATWKRDSPKMWARLRAAKLTGPLAYVLQARMWAEQDQLIRSGMQVTDAREQAEREHLMLEEETDQPEERPLLPQYVELEKELDRDR